MRVDVGAVSEFPERELRLVTVRGHGVGVLRWKGRFYAIHNRCSHQSGPLCLGVVSGRLHSDQPGRMELDDTAPVIACPWHGWEFDCETGRALWNEEYAVRVFPVHVESDRVFVEIGRESPASARPRTASPAGGARS